MLLLRHMNIGMYAYVI